MLVLPIVILATAIFGSLAETDGISPRPNIIFVVADDLVRTFYWETFIAPTFIGNYIRVNKEKII